MVLVGPSGCGKSTLLGIMGGLLTPTRRRGPLRGRDRRRLPERIHLRVPGFRAAALAHGRRQRRIGAGGSPAARRTPARVSPRCWHWPALPSSPMRWPRQLSGGMRQRVGIARALAVRPECLLMDEPLAALDAQTRGLLLDEFAALIERAGTTTIYVTHNLAEAVRLGQQIVVLSRRPGRVRTIRAHRSTAGRTRGDRSGSPGDRGGAVAPNPRRCRRGRARHGGIRKIAAGRDQVHSGRAGRYGSMQRSAR